MSLKPKTKTYNKELKDLKSFLSKRRKLSTLAREIGVDVRTVHYAFKVESPENLTGKKIDVIKRAYEMKAEIETTLKLDIKTESISPDDNI